MLLLALALFAAGCSGGTTDGTGADVTVVPAPDDASPTASLSSAPPSTGTDEGDEGPPWYQTGLRLGPVATLDEPIALAVLPGRDLLWVAERVGRIRVVVPPPSGSAEEGFRVLPDPVLNIVSQVSTRGEGGLLGLAFSPDGRHLYLSYTDTGGTSVVSEVPVDGSADPPRLDIRSERILLRVEQPFSNHNGGDLSFGPDGLLYLALGDGGSAGDPGGNGQDRSTLLGSIIRIDPAAGGGSPYTVPSTNPFVDGPAGARPEIWLWGVRNPWRFSFDRATGDLWVADVGQGKLEEINRLAAAGGGGRGANLGWNLMEGSERFAGDPPTDHVGPLYVYGHENGRCSITGGYVYRGTAIPALDGVYVYGDFCSGEIMGLELADGELRVANLLLDRPASRVISFGQGADGELYVLEQEGRLTRVEPA